MSGVPIGKEHHPELRDDGVEGGVGEGKALRVGLLERDVARVRVRVRVVTRWWPGRGLRAGDGLRRLASIKNEARGTLGHVLASPDDVLVWLRNAPAALRQRGVRWRAFQRNFPLLHASKPTCGNAFVPTASASCSSAA